MGRTLSKVEETCRLIEERGGAALAVQGNVKQKGELSQCVDQVAETLGGVQILVNNAQEVPLGPLHAVTDELFEAGWESGPRE